MPSKDGLRLSSTTARDGLFFNAFEDLEPTATASSSPGFMTPTWQEQAVKSPRKNKSTLRRRVSDIAPRSPISRNGQPCVSAWPLGHSRSQTEQSGSLHPHPLGVGPDTFAGNSGSTRPHLSRLLSAWESPAGSDVEGERKTSSSDAGSFLESGSAAKDEEKTVLVHEVSPKDSLAGVALKYGITLAELRKANHLWSSDSIHLRKVLYIPLDSSSYSSRVKPLIDLDEPTPTSSSDLYHDKSHTSTIRRIPASQLSFFPPPAKPSAPPNVNSSDPFDNRYSYTPPLSSSKRSVSGSGSGSPAQHSRALTTILTAFPIAASTRDTIIARLSFDSERPSMSEGQGHELDEVRTSSLTARPSPWSSSFQDEIGRRTSPSAIRPRLSSPKFAPRSVSPTPVDHRKSWTHTDVTESHTPIRTVQLEPSPAMTVPTRSVTLKSRPRELGGLDVDELSGSR